MIGLGAGPGGLVLTWAAPGALQAADNVIGPWADVPGAVSPYTVQQWARENSTRDLPLRITKQFARSKGIHFGAGGAPGAGARFFDHFA
jgi:hypothetical protein